MGDPNTTSAAAMHFEFACESDNPLDIQRQSMISSHRVTLSARCIFRQPIYRPNLLPRIFLSVIHRWVSAADMLLLGTHNSIYLTLFSLSSAGQMRTSFVCLQTKFPTRFETELNPRCRVLIWVIALRKLFELKHCFRLKFHYNRLCVREKTASCFERSIALEIVDWKCRRPVEQPTYGC